MLNLVTKDTSIMGYKSIKCKLETDYVEVNLPPNFNISSIDYENLAKGEIESLLKNKIIEDIFGISKYDVIKILYKILPEIRNVDEILFLIEKLKNWDKFKDIS